MVIQAFVYEYYISICEERHKECRPRGRGGGGIRRRCSSWMCYKFKKILPSKHNTKQYCFPTFPSQKVNSIIVKKNSPHTTQWPKVRSLCFYINRGSFPTCEFFPNCAECPNLIRLAFIIYAVETGKGKESKISKSCLLRCDLVPGSVHNELSMGGGGKRCSEVPAYSRRRPYRSAVTSSESSFLC
jgi:hypothetical protein